MVMSSMSDSLLLTTGGGLEATGTVLSELETAEIGGTLWRIIQGTIFSRNLKQKVNQVSSTGVENLRVTEDEDILKIKSRCRMIGHEIM